MLDIRDILNEEVYYDTSDVDYGKSLIEDLLVWIDKFNNYLVKAEMSKNTIISYNDTLKALLGYAEVYLKKHDRLSDLSLESVNDFLLWMENYAVNKRYGALKERLSLLLDYIRYAQKSDSAPFSIREAYLRDYCGDMQQICYVLDSFEKYYCGDEVPFNKINNSYIKNYIVSIPKASIGTLMQRRAVLHTFISFIGKTSESDVFESVLKEMKIYKKQKGSLHGLKSFEDDALEKIYSFIREYTSNPKKYLSRVTHLSQFVAYRNTAMIILMVGAGCRVSEALALQFNDIKDDGTGTYSINIKNGKGNKQRTTYIKKELFFAHYEYLKSLSACDTNFLSRNNKNVGINRNNLYNFSKWMFGMIGEDKRGLHIFRHRFGENFACKNGNIKVLKDLLGHSSMETTMIYSHIGEKTKRDAVEGLS